MQFCLISVQLCRGLVTRIPVKLHGLGLRPCPHYSNLGQRPYIPYAQDPGEYTKSTGSWPIWKNWWLFIL